MRKIFGKVSNIAKISAYQLLVAKPQRDYNMVLMPNQNCQTSRSHQEPFSIQFAIFLPNKVGKLLELMNEFSSRKIKLAGFCVVNSTDWHVVRAVFYDPGKARELLTRSNYAFSETPVLLVELSDASVFESVCNHLLKAEISIEYAFWLGHVTDFANVIALSVEDQFLATQILIKHGFALLGMEDLKDPGRNSQ